MWLSAIIKWNSTSFWKRKDNRFRKPWDRLPGSTVTDAIIHNRTPHTRENQRHEKAAAQCCLTDVETKVKEVEDSLYWAESLPPQGSTMPQSPRWGKQPHRFPLHPGFEPCFEALTCYQEPQTNKPEMSSDHIAPTRDPLAAWGDHL